MDELIMALFYLILGAKCACSVLVRNHGIRYDMEGEQTKPRHTGAKARLACAELLVRAVCRAVRKARKAGELTTVVLTKICFLG
jgi:hypothetical protein